MHTLCVHVFIQNSPTVVVVVVCDSSGQITFDIIRDMLKLFEICQPFVLSETVDYSQQISCVVKPQSRTYRT